MVLEDPIADTTLWVAGRRLVGERTLAEEERRAIENLARKHRRRGYGMLLAGPALCLLGLGGSLLASDVELRFEFVMIGVFVGLLMLGIPLAVASRHWLRAARALSEDARLGRVD